MAKYIRILSFLEARQEQARSSLLRHVLSDARWKPEAKKRVGRQELCRLEQRQERFCLVRDAARCTQKHDKQIDGQHQLLTNCFYYTFHTPA
jgi:hypothetical protein